MFLTYIAKSGFPLSLLILGDSLLNAFQCYIVSHCGKEHIYLNRFKGMNAFVLYKNKNLRLTLAQQRRTCLTYEQGPGICPYLLTKKSKYKVKFSLCN